MPPSDPRLAVAHAALTAALEALEALTTCETTEEAEAAPAVRPPQRNVVVSLFDYTTLALQPWLRRGYECHAYDLRHPPGRSRTVGSPLVAWSRETGREPRTAPRRRPPPRA